MKQLITILLIFTFQYSIGQVVENFAATDIGKGQEIELSTLSNKKLIVVVFFSNDCAFTRHYVDRIKQLNDLLENQNSTLLLVNSNNDQYSPKESEENMQKFLSQNNMKIPYISDKERTIAESFGARRTPEAFVLQFDAGQAQIRYKGAIDDNAQSAGDVNHSFLNDAVRNLLSNKEVETKSTRANGCLIK